MSTFGGPFLFYLPLLSRSRQLAFTACLVFHSPFTLLPIALSGEERQLKSLITQFPAVSCCFVLKRPQCTFYLLDEAPTFTPTENNT